jgi:cytochrome c-type biogenesis protein CcmH
VSGFIAIAGFITLAALIALLYPLLRRREGAPEAWRSGGLAAVLIALGASALYPLWSNFNWHEPAPAMDSPQAMVGRLARRLEKQPDDLEGWLRLGRSYLVLEQFPLAARAYERANKLSNEKSPEAAMGLAEALFSSGRSDFSGRAGRLFEQALALDPNSTKALFYSATAAAERNELALARERFVRLRDVSNPPADVRDMIDQQIKALDSMAKMASATPGAPASQPMPVAQAAAASPAAAAAQPVAATAVVTVPLRVTLSASVAAKAGKGAPLFVLARVPGQRGAPLAVRRLNSTFPQEVELRSSDAMVAGNGFTAGQEIEVEARVANGGGAISASGDPFGTARLKAGQGGRVTIEINQLKP